ncbi:MAG: SDR family NAD(P)-dependent oxidoreductase [Chthoniobacterales bacterium]
MQAETVLITAANRGIGLALSEALLREGYVVIAGCRHPEAATHLQRLAASQTGLIDVVLLDVNQTVSPELNGQFLDRFGKPGEYPW